ncbi:MAG: extracellular solute-binding protein [Candidatus Coproplasma sp.]
MKKHIKKLFCLLSASVLTLTLLPLTACSKQKEETLTLRVSNLEEYIDLGGWGNDELIDIENPYDTEAEGIFGKNSMVDDFTNWFNSSDFGFNIKVEYSTFGTNEDLYNRLKLGDTYDLVCPSDYMIMKLIDEGKVQEFSEGFFDTANPNNYYTNCVSPYITNTLSDIDPDPNPEHVFDLTKYSACYMWGTTGIIYNPDLTEEEDVSRWDILLNKDYQRQVTIKDNVRDAYFSALAILNYEELITDSITPQTRSQLLNATDEETVNSAEQILKNIKNNVYSFETDSGKADMISGKVVANFQWSGDGVYIMDLADEDDTELWYSVPEECTNLWFDGWVMLKDGINGDTRKQTAAEAFINFLSRPDNAIRNMYYIGYTSAIAGDTVFEYLDWNYGMTFDPSDEEYFDSEITEVYEYDLSYFFGDDYSLYIDASQLNIEGGNSRTEQLGLEDYGNNINYTVYSSAKISKGRQAFAQYPTEEVISRSVVMLDFGGKLSDINQMWINVRCLDVKDFNPVVVWTIVGIVLAGAVAIVLYKFRYSIFIRKSKNN